MAHGQGPAHMRVTAEKLWVEAAWPSDRVGEAVEALGRRSRLRTVMTGARTVGGPVPRHTKEAFALMQGAARALGLEAEPVEVSYREIDRFLKDAAPLIVALPNERGRVLCVLGSRRRRLRLLAPDLGEPQVPLTEIGDLLRAPLELPVKEECARAAADCGAGPARTNAVRDALLEQLLVGAASGGCWILRPAPELTGWRRLQQNGSLRWLGLFLACHLAFVAFWLGSWLILGKSVLEDRISVAALVPWALLIATLIPLRLMRTVLAGLFAIETGTALKQRLLAGAQSLNPASIRHLGVGQLLGRALEAEAMETLTLVSGLVSLTAILELVLAGGVLAAGVGGLPHTVLLIISIGAMSVVAFRHHNRLRAWADARLDLTHEAVENLVGHRTRLVQQAPSEWHQRIDQLQTHYVGSCEAVDRLAATLHAVVPRAWLLVGLLPILPSFISGRASAVALATSFGGVLLAYRAFRELATGLDHATVAAVSWTRLRSLVQPGATDEVESAGFVLPAAPLADRPGPGAIPLLEGSGLTYRHASREEAAVKAASVKVRPSDRILIEGPSGSGKSTLGSLLSGNRLSSHGVLLLGGLDLRTVGADRWRRRVVLVPQFHDNRLFMGSLAFNLLMGREWPPSGEALEEAEEVCQALGLGDLLDRMPGRLSQPVGETGWRLSHGEQTRVFIARAALQRPEIMILDESLAALDTENLSRVLAFLRNQPTALVAIAHP